MAKRGGDSPRGLYFGWVVLAACFLIIFMSQGARNSAGLFFKPILSDFGWSRAALALPISLSLLLFGVFQPVAGRAADRWGARWVVSFAGIATVLALGLMSRVRSLGEVYLFYGVILAIGSGGTAFAVFTPLVAKWFAERRGMAMAIATTGTSAGQLVLFPLISLAIAGWGWRWTFAGLSLLYLVVCLPLAFLLLRDPPARLPSPPGPPGRGAALRRRPPPYELPWGRCLTTRPFFLLAGSFFACGFTVTMMGVHFIPYATDRGFSPQEAAYAMALGGGLNIVGTLLAGSASDRFGRKLPLTLTYLVRGSGFFLFLLYPSLPTLYLSGMVVGLSWVATVPLTSSLTGDFFGPRNLGVLFGLVSLSHQIGSGVSSWLGGYIFDRLGSYDLAFLIAVLVLVAAGGVSYAIDERQVRAGLPAPQEARA
ncbi:MAG: MFS transporter [Nitrospinota bacterium]